MILMLFELNLCKHERPLLLYVNPGRAMSDDDVFPTAVSSAATPEFDSDFSASRNDTGFHIRIPKKTSIIRIQPRESSQSRPASHRSMSRASSDARSRLSALTPRKGKLFEPPRAQSIRAKSSIQVTKSTQNALDNHRNLPHKIDDLKDTIFQVSVIQQKHIEGGEYPQAQEMEKLLHALNTKLKHEESKKAATEELRDLLAKKMELQAIVDTVVNDWNAQFSAFLDATQAQAQSMKQQHIRELSDFDSKKPNDLLPQYRQRSANLINLREKERAMALNKKFVNAQKIKTVADQIEEDETRRQFQRMNDDWTQRRDNLLARQRQQMQVFFSHTETTRIKMIQQRDNVIEGYVARMDRLDRQINQIRSQGDAAVDQLTNFRISKSRARHIIDGEYSHPIARLTTGKSFTKARAPK